MAHDSLASCSPAITSSPAGSSASDALRKAYMTTPQLHKVLGSNRRVHCSQQASASPNADGAEAQTTAITPIRLGSRQDRNQDQNLDIGLIHKTATDQPLPQWCQQACTQTLSKTSSGQALKICERPALHKYIARSQLGMRQQRT